MLCSLSNFVQCTIFDIKNTIFDNAHEQKNAPATENNDRCADTI